MRLFTTQTIDNKMNKQILLSDASYNKACFWLYSKGFKDPDKTNTDYKSNVTTLYFSIPKKAIFYYDENRGYLLQD